MTGPSTVLVVDDEPDACWVMEALLRSHGFEVTTAGTGDEALRCLTESAQMCRLILVDAKLPDTEGVHLARRIRCETPCTAPVILVSGYFYEDDSLVQDSLRTGIVSAFVAKPFRHEELLGVIEVVLSSAVPPGS